MKNKICTLFLTVFIFAYARPVLAEYYNVEIIPQFAGSKVVKDRCSDALETCILNMELPYIKGGIEQKEYMSVVSWFLKDRSVFLFKYDRKYFGVYRDENDDYFIMDIDNSRDMRETMSVYKPDASKKIAEIDPDGAVRLPIDFLPRMEIRIIRTEE